MANKANEQYLVVRNAGWSFLALIRIHSGSNAVQASFSAITRTIAKASNGGWVVVATDTITIATAVYDTLQSNVNLWSEAGSAVPYNFEDQVPASKVSTSEVHCVQYTFTPATGQTIKTKPVELVPLADLSA